MAANPSPLYDFEFAISLGCIGAVGIGHWTTPASGPRSSGEFTGGRGIGRAVSWHHHERDGAAWVVQDSFNRRVHRTSTQGGERIPRGADTRAAKQDHVSRRRSRMA